MPRTLVSAFLYATVIACVVASDPVVGCCSAADGRLLLQQPASCALRDGPEEPECASPSATSPSLRREADETIMLQQPLFSVRMAGAGATESIPAASDVLADDRLQHKEEAGEQVPGIVDRDNITALLAFPTGDSAEGSALLMCLSSWLSGVKAFKELALTTLTSRRETVAALHLFGVDPETTQQDKVEVNTASGHTHVLLMAVAVPLVGLGVALFVTKVMPPLISDPASGTCAGGAHHSPSAAVTGICDRATAAISRNVSSLKPGSKAGSKSGLKAASSVPKPQSTARIAVPERVDEPQSDPVHSPEPSGQAVNRIPQIPKPPISILPELTVPDGHECILGIPSLAGAVPDERTLRHVTDRDGRPLLYVGLTRSPSGGEYVALAKMDKQEIAFCETGSAVRAEGCAGKIFGWDGEIHARLREADDEPRTATGSGRFALLGASNPAHFTYVVLSAAGPPWQLQVTGNIVERKVIVEDFSRRLLATTSQMQDDCYMLRLGPRTDVCAIVVALLAIQRLVASRGGPLTSLPAPAGPEHVTGGSSLRGIPPPHPPPPRPAPGKRIRPGEFEL